jgi:predicted ester cyclase
MSEHGIGAIYRRLIEEGFNKGELYVADEIATPDFMEHEGNPHGVGPEVLKEAISGLRAILPDLRFEIKDLAVVDDKVWSRIEATGTNTGPVLGQPPTGKPVRMSFMDVSRFANGRLAEHWGIPDNLAMLTQLGLVTLPSTDNSDAAVG